MKKWCHEIHIPVAMKCGNAVLKNHYYEQRQYNIVDIRDFHHDHDNVDEQIKCARKWDNEMKWSNKAM